MTPDTLDRTTTPLSAGELLGWVRAISIIATHYRISFSPGNLQSSARWLQDQPLPDALGTLARQAGLGYQQPGGAQEEISAWRLPLAVQLNDGQIGVIKSFDGEDQVNIQFSGDTTLTSPLSLSELLPAIKEVAVFRPAGMPKDARTAFYLANFTPDWMRKLVVRNLKPWWHILAASLIVNTLAMSGILFSMQVYDRVIPAQSIPTLYVLFSGVIISIIFAFIFKQLRGHITDLLGKQADMRISDRVFGHALRLRNSAIPRSTGSFIAQVRDLEQMRELITSTTMTAIADVPFFLLFMLVLVIVSPQLAWIAPLAVVLMLLPGLLSQRKLAVLANQAVHESTLRNAVLVESLQGIEDIKLMQAEDRFLQQWNSYIQIAAQSGIRTRKLTHALTSWGTSVQSLVYASAVLFGAPRVIEGDMTTGAVVAASMLSSRMIGPMTALCGILARWQQVKAAKAGLDNIMRLPAENGPDEQRIPCPVLYGHYHFKDAVFRYPGAAEQPQLQIARLDIQPGERIAILGRNGAGKSTLLQAMVGGIDLAEGELRLDNLSLPHIDIADLRRNVGLLTQNARLFHGTLRENLALGAPEATDEDIFRILEMCSAVDFVRRLPQGLNHPIMEGGTGLSGGQRQSILLARMLLRNPGIVLLDEPTAALDDHTEREFLQRLKPWLAGRTLIVATHRAAVLELVERVLVLKDGKLVMDAPKDQAIARTAEPARHKEASNEIQSA
ncbi:type I secretion system permease/ATPase [Entomohabitans teleogrylli]|uniref:type I secretion system permease/ATPase n=1 Tax=Entomohabitans teleogrylli TaxID=1384589 RepID=UPI00073D3E94|nr:type I secretion system permease/ATPase [Entomohabitans teleogrylli]